MKFELVRAGEFFRSPERALTTMLWLKVKAVAIDGETMNAVDVDGMLPGKLHHFNPDEEVERVIVGVKMTIGGER